MSGAQVIQRVVSEPFAQNAFILHEEGGETCWIVDPGFETDPLFEYLRNNDLTPLAILNTHGHVDHIAGNGAVRSVWPNCPIWIGALDAPMLTDGMLNLSAVYGFEILSPPADRLLREGETFSGAGWEFTVYDVPGHSPGHVVFHQKAPTSVVIGGDVLFAGGVGRTDFPGGSFDQLRDGIEKKLLVLPDDTKVYPGHGNSTTIGREKARNPFLRATPPGSWG